MRALTDQDHMEKSVIGPVIESLLENFDCQPVLFVGSGLARRYTDSPDWEGLLRFALTMFPGTAPNYDYLAQKHNNNLVLIGSEIASHIFEWAWGNGKNSFPPELFTHKDKSIFLKYLVSKMLKDLKPGEAIASSVTFFDEFDALRSIRPHAIITTNYDTMLEDIYLGYEPIVGKQVLRYNLNAYGEVYHIHGSVNDPSTLDYRRYRY